MGRWCLNPLNSLRPSDAYICVCELTIIGSDNGLSPERRQVIIWTNAGILLIGPLGTNFSEILIEIQIFSLKKIHLKVSHAKCFSCRLGLNVLIRNIVDKLDQYQGWYCYGSLRDIACCFICSISRSCVPQGKSLRWNLSCEARVLPGKLQLPIHVVVPCVKMSSEATVLVA